MHKIIVGLIAFGLSTSASWAAERDPVQIIVSLKDQHLRVYRGTEQITEAHISSGKKGHTTPTGIFSILQKNRYHRSNIYNNAKMPFMQRLTWSGIALHASNKVPRRPASHGCVRMTYKFARSLFKLDTWGAHVIIEDEVSAPEAISHANLFQPAKVWKVASENDTWVNKYIQSQNAGMVDANPKYPSRIFITRRTHKDDLVETQRLLNKLGFDAGKVDGYMGKQTSSAIRTFQERYGLEKDGMVTNDLLDELYIQAVEFRPKNGRIMVRQHQKQVFEAEVDIRDSHLPLGSHLVTVSGFDPDNQTTDWLSVSLNDRMYAKLHLRAEMAPDTSSDRHSLSSALDRIVMDDATKRQVSRLLTSRSSIAISDNGMSEETGAKGTDFIVLTKPEASQGLIAVTDKSSNQS